jgi:hypothetical protein
MFGMAGGGWLPSRGKYRPFASEALQEVQTYRIAEMAKPEANRVLPEDRERSVSQRHIFTSLFYQSLTRATDASLIWYVFMIASPTF